MNQGAEGVPLDYFRLARRAMISGDYMAVRYLDPTLNRNRDVQRIVD
jgi:taurine dioxygenase